MGHSQAEKARNRERILAEAARQVRDGGLESVAVGKLMQSVGLTHGGFYGHFTSRSDLMAQALERALAEGEAGARAVAAEPGQPRGFAGFVRSYLSRAHRDQRTSGCAIAALASDVARADAPSRAVMEAHIERFIENVRASLGRPDDAEAIATVSAMIGALAISRTLTDPKRSDAVLRAVKSYLIAMSEEGAS